MKTSSLAYTAALLVATALTPVLAADMTHDRSLNVGKEPYDPLFPLGYGMTYASPAELAALPEDPGIPAELMSTGSFFDKGLPVQPWSLRVSIGSDTTRVTTVPAEVGGRVKVSAVDDAVQEGARRFVFDGSGKAAVQITSESIVNRLCSVHKRGQEYTPSTDHDLACFATWLRDAPPIPVSEATTAEAITAAAAAIRRTVAAAEAAAVTAVGTPEIVVAETVALISATPAAIPAAPFVETHAVYYFPAPYPC